MQYVWIGILGIIYLAWIIRSIIDLLLMIEEIRNGDNYIENGAWFTVCVILHLIVLFSYSLGTWLLNHR